MTKKIITKKYGYNIIVIIILILCFIISIILIFFILKNYTNTIHNSYKISAKQLAKNISLYVKVRDLQSIIYFTNDSFIFLNADYIEVIDDENEILFSKVKDSVKKFVVTEFIYYENEIIGKINYSYKINYFSDDFKNFFIKLLILFLIAFIVISTIYIYSKKRASNLNNFFLKVKHLLTPNEEKMKNNLIENDLNYINEKIIKLISEFNVLTNQAKELEYQSQIGKSAQMIIHDIRKPFNLFKLLFVNLAENMNIDSARKIKLQNDVIDKIKSTIPYVENLLEDILEIGKKYELKITKIDLIEFIKNEVLILSESYENVELIFNDIEEISVDKFKMLRVITNILNNAIEANKGNGRVWIKLSLNNIENEKFTEIIIGNSGSYVPENEINKLFDLFYSKNKVNGTGLGLAICKRIIEFHNGKISCHSEKSFGTEFKITLPNKI